MDSSQKGRMMNEFTAEINLNRPGGLIDAAKIEKYLSDALKPLSDAGNVLKRVVTDPRSGTRSITYAYQGSAGVQQSVEAMRRSAAENLGFTDPANAPF